MAVSRSFLQVGLCFPVITDLSGVPAYVVMKKLTDPFLRSEVRWKAHSVAPNCKVPTGGSLVN